MAECSTRNATIIKIKIALVKDRLNLSSKSTAAADVHLKESLLDNWLKNNRITVDKVHYLRSLLVSVFFCEFLVSKLISRPR